MTCRFCDSTQLVAKGLCRAHYQRERPGSSVTIYELGVVFYFREGGRRTVYDVTTPDYDETTERDLLTGRRRRYVLDGAEDLPDFADVKTSDFNDL